MAQKQAQRKEIQKRAEVTTARGEIGERQLPTIKIHKSVEHGSLTPVFGTSCPPRGISGRLRDIAYRYSEDRIRHWAMLMVADRVDVYESLARDLARGQVPNLFKERGWKSELTYGSSERQRRWMIAGAVGAAILGLMLMNRRRERSSRRGRPRLRLVKSGV